MPLSVIGVPSGEIRLVPGREYGRKLEIISVLFQNGFSKLEETGSHKNVSEAAATLRHLNENTSVVFCKR